MACSIEQRSNSKASTKDRRDHLGEQVNLLGPIVDFAVGAGPWLLSVGTTAALLTLWIESSSDLPEKVRMYLQNQAALTALGSMLSFLVVSRISANLAQNVNVVCLFSDLCGSSVALVVNLRGLAKRVKANDGCVSKLGLAIASLPHAAYYRAALGNTDTNDMKLVVHKNNKNVNVLPVLDDAGAQDDFEKLKVETNLPVFETLMLQATIYICNIENDSHIKTPTVGTIMKCLNDIASAEGKIDAIIAFRHARIIDVVIFSLFVLYYLLLLVSELIPQSGWSSTWVSMIIVLSTAGLYGISVRLKNPFMDRSGGQNQRSNIVKTLMKTEELIVATMDTKHDIQDRHSLMGNSTIRCAANGGRHIAMPMLSDGAGEKCQLLPFRPF